MHELQKPLFKTIGSHSNLILSNTQSLAFMNFEVIYESTIYIWNEKCPSKSRMEAKYQQIQVFITGIPIEVLDY